MKLRNRFLSVLLATVLAIPVSAIPAGTVQAADAATKEIQILATSDLHGKFLPYDYANNEESKGGSMAQVATIVKQKRTENPNTLLMDIGDTIESNSASLFFDEGTHPMVAGYNLMKYDVWEAGNHEFNYGVDTLLKVKSQFEGTFMCGNVFDKEGKALGEDYKLFEKDGVKIAVIGYVTPNIVKWDAPNLANYDVKNPLADGLMEKALKKAEEDKADIIVAALHMGTESEFSAKGTGAFDYADAYPQIDVILASHGHTKVNEKRGDVLVIENLDRGQTMTDVDITVKSDGKGGYEVSEAKAEQVAMSSKDKDGNTVYVDADTEMVTALAKYDARAKADAVTEVGKLEGGDLVPAAEIPGITQSQIQETAMMDLINLVQKQNAGADVSAAAVLSASANMKEGPIRKCDTALIYKFDNTLYKLEVTGKQLKTYMEWSANYYNTYKDGDLTISFNENMRSYLYDMFYGVNYDIDISKEPGSRIVNLTKEDGTPIKDTDVLTLAVNNYRANSQLLSYGGGVYSQEKGDELPKIIEKDMDAGKQIRTMISEYIAGKGGTIKPEVGSNWKIIGNNWNDGLHAKAAQLVKEEKIKIPASADGRTPNVKSVTVADLKDLVKVAEATIDADGGVADAATVYAEEGTAYGKLPTATKEGYTFDGWYTEKTGGTQVTAETLAQTGTLYARWTKSTEIEPVVPAVTVPGKVTLKSVKAGKKSMTVTYGKIAGVKGYRVEYATSKTFKNAKHAYVTKTSAKVTKLTSGRKYYVRVRAYVTGEDGKRVYGKASSVKTVKVK